MEANDLIVQLIAQLKEQIATRDMVIQTLVGGIVFLALTLGSFFLVYRKDKRTSDTMFKKMNDDFMEVMKHDIESRKELKHSLDNNTRAITGNSELIKEFPDIMKDTITTAFKLFAK